MSAEQVPSSHQERPNPAPAAMLCPYCGKVSRNMSRCTHCSGYLDPLSRQATQNSMGPWFILNEANPTRPGCSFDTLRELIRRGRVMPNSVIRGPSTRQFWSIAIRVPGVASLFGRCHNCRAQASPDAAECRACGASFAVETDRQFLGLGPIHLLPGQAAADEIAAASQGRAKLRA